MMASLKSIPATDRHAANIVADDIRLLAAVGFLAARSGLTERAMRIFSGLAVIRPKKDFPLTGIVFSHLAAGQYEKALQFISGLDCHRVDASVDLRALKALVLHLQQRSPEATQLIATVVDDLSFSDADYSLAGKVAVLLNTIPNELAVHAP